MHLEEIQIDKGVNMKLEALKSGFQSLISQMQSLIANGTYEEDEPLEKKDVSSIMDEAEEGMDVEKASQPQDPFNKADMLDFFKKKNLGSRPKGLKAVMVEAKIAKPVGFQKGKK